MENRSPGHQVTRSPGRVHAVILAGGKGSRFWPLSRLARPKPFISIGKGAKTLLRQTIDRARAIARSRDIHIVVNERYRSLIEEGCGRFPSCNVIKEPEGRNTLSAIALAAISLRRNDPDAIMVVMPADHLIGNVPRFAESVSRAVKCASQRRGLCVIGVRPRYPAVGFGYMKKGSGREGLFSVERFVEKPSLARARRFVASGEYLWNAGIFVWRADAFLDCVRIFEPGPYKKFMILERLMGGKGYARNLRRHYSSMKSVSVDYAILEKAKGMVWCVEGTFDWQDIGSWVSLGDIFDEDANENVLRGEVAVYDARECVVFGRSGRLVGLCGVWGLAVIETPDATLVCSKERSEDVKRLVEKMGRKRNFKKYL